MAKAIAIFTGGVTELCQIAVRSDGVCFSRFQYSDPYSGRRWSRWSETGERLGANASANLESLELGWAKLRRASPNDCFINNRALFDAKGQIKVRLP